MMRKDDNMEIKIIRADSSSPNELFEELSELDRLCVGSDGWSAESFKKEAGRNHRYVLYIAENGHIAGLLCGYYVMNEGDITSLAVHPDFRRRGLASALIAEFEKILPKDAVELFLEVRQSNEAAISLYKKCGFEVLAKRKNFYSNPDEDGFLMLKNINIFSGIVIHINPDRGKKQ